MRAVVIVPEMTCSSFDRSANAAMGRPQFATWMVYYDDTYASGGGMTYWSPEVSTYQKVKRSTRDDKKGKVAY